MAHQRRTTARLRFGRIEEDLRELGRRMESEPGGNADAENRLDAGHPGSSRALSADDNQSHHQPPLLMRETTQKQERESALLNELVNIKEKLRIEASQASQLERYIQATSMRDAIRKYGGGVVRVQLDLDFPEDREISSGGTTTGSSNNNNNDNNKNNKGGSNKSTSNRLNGKGKTNNNNNGSSSSSAAAAAAASTSSSSTVLVLEMAPLELMPHSVYTFLEMVHAELFDGCSFILNAMHVVKAAPLPYKPGGSTAQMVRAFTKLGLDTVSFREYSPAYPHEKYTVGFAADGSPSFYVNTGDNTAMHKGEPCFARIVSGFETLERLEAAPVRNGMWYRKRIGIQRARIL